MKDLYLDPITHDLALVNYDLVLIEGAEQVKQNIKMRLLAISGEWFLDTRVGVDYQNKLWIKNPDLSIVDSIFKATIIETAGVTEILYYTSNFDSSTRTFSMSFEVATEFGNVSNTLEV